MAENTSNAEEAKKAEAKKPTAAEAKKADVKKPTAAEAPQAEAAEAPQAEATKPAVPMGPNGEPDPKVKKVTALVPKDYILRVTHSIKMDIKAGVQELEEWIVDHWWSKAQGVERYKK